MIENYKGWDIVLTWEDNNALNSNQEQFNSFNKKKKWLGTDLKGHKIYGSSLKEIRHIIDYPNLNLHN